jgi:hypothetical protein
MNTYVLEETAPFIIGIMSITVACQRRSHVYLKRPYTCTRLHGFKCCKSVKAVVSYRVTLLRCACFRLIDMFCFVWRALQQVLFDVEVSRDEEMCWWLGGVRGGEQWGGGKRHDTNWTNTKLCSIIFVVSLLYRRRLYAAGDTCSWRTDCYGTLVRMNFLWWNCVFISLFTWWTTSTKLDVCLTE